VESCHESIWFPAGLYAATLSDFWSGFEEKVSKVAYRECLNGNIFTTEKCIQLKTNSTVDKKKYIEIISLGSQLSEI